MNDEPQPKFHHINDENFMRKASAKSKFGPKSELREGNYFRLINWCKLLILIKNHILNMIYIKLPYLANLRIFYVKK